MRLYFDTCYLYRVYANEPGFREVRALLQECHHLCSSCHARIEFSSILLRKRREGVLNSAECQAKHAQFLQELEEGHLVLYPLEENIIRIVERVMAEAPATTFLRAADAHHLAAAAYHGFESVYSNDRHFLAAAPLFGLTPVNVIKNE